MTTPYPIPEDETERLAALHRYHLLDTPAEEAFDCIARLAARIFGMPITLISFIDERRNWFKSRIGVKVEWLDRGSGFCAHAILGKKPMVVEDASTDKRFVNNPAVASGPKLRFYAGAPLLTHDGFALGTLCLLDRQPHWDFDAEKQAVLQDLANMIVAQIEAREAVLSLKREAEERTRTEAALTLAVQAAELGMWNWEVGTGSMNLSDRCLDILGRSRDSISAFDDFLATVHPDDRQAVYDALHATATGTGPRAFHIDHRILKPDHSIRWVQQHGGLIPRANLDTALPLGMTGMMLDITEQKLAEQQLRTSLREKEALLREIHHRVKNNLQGIWGMLQVERHKLQHLPEAVERLDAVAQRIFVLGQIHQQLYSSGELARVNVALQFQKLAESFLELRSHNGARIDVDADVLTCDLETALPLCLIVNELTINSLKHAVPGTGSSLIRITLRQNPAGDRVELCVHDNGRSVPVPAITQGIGLTLVRALTVQIGGTLTMESDEGWSTRIDIPASHFGQLT